MPQNVQRFWEAAAQELPVYYLVESGMQQAELRIMQLRLFWKEKI